MLNDIGLKYSTGSSWSPYVREGQELGQELLQSHGYQLDKEGKIMLSGEGNPIHPTPTSLMIGPAVDAQSPQRVITGQQESTWRAAQKDSCLQTGNQLHQDPS